jgi:hypothetical protein
LARSSFIPHRQRAKFTARRRQCPASLMGLVIGIRGLAAVPARDLIHKGDDTMSQVRSRYSHHP